VLLTSNHHPLDVHCQQMQSINFACTISSLMSRPTVCERSVGTVFQLPRPDAIYSRDEEKNGNVGGLADCLGWRTAHIVPVEGVIEGRKRLGRWSSHVTSGSARYTVVQVTGTRYAANTHLLLRVRCNGGYWRAPCLERRQRKSRAQRVPV
jgi:hypothetical protein